MTRLERIDRYLSGQMSPEERRAFEAELAADESLAQELEAQREMWRFLQRRHEREARRKQLQAIGEEFFQQPARVVPMRTRVLRWAAVAAAVAVLLVGYWLMRPSLYEQFAQHPPLALVEKSGAATDDLAAAERAFNGGDYAKAAPILERWLQRHPDDDLVRIYLGIARMEMNQLEEARNLFQNLRTNDPALRDFAQWNLALSYLKEGDTEACRQALHNLSDGSAYAEQARRLLERLSN